jgi:hypothetical protein
VNTQWAFSEHSVNIQWAFSEHSVNIQWAFSESLVKGTSSQVGPGGTALVWVLEWINFREPRPMTRRSEYKKRLTWLGNRSRWQQRSWQWGNIMNIVIIFVTLSYFSHGHPHHFLRGHIISHFPLIQTSENRDISHFPSIQTSENRNTFLFLARAPVSLPAGAYHFPLPDYTNVWE